MRDRADNCVIICSIENVDPMGVHTGDSITVAPQQTLTDVEYQQMRDAAFACIRRVGVETGGSNVQFAVDPATGEQVVIEMNPRVSRSSALASKATGFPIAKIAAKLAVGYTLDEIPNDITAGMTPASFEPRSTTSSPRSRAGRSRSCPARPASSARRCSRSARRWRSGARSRRACRRGCARSSRVASASTATRPRSSWRSSTTTSCSARSRSPTPDRIFQIGELLRRGVVDRGDPRRVPDRPVVPRPDADHHRGAGRARRRSASTACARDAVAAGQAARLLRRASSPTCGSTDELTCATPARRPVCSRPTRRSTRARPSSPPRRRTTTRPTRTRARCARRPPKVVILGSGPNRIGQGIEFDYCCVHACFALREAGYETVMVNCNPETVSHRLRHERPPLLRAAHARGRAQRDRRRDGRDRRVAEVVVARRADAAEAGRRDPRRS